MKKCGACGQEFLNRFNFCPVDGEPLAARQVTASFDYQPTIIRDDSLPRRLVVQVVFLSERAKLAWLRFRSDPRAFLTEEISELAQTVRIAFAQPYLRTALLAALTTVLCIIGSVTFLERQAKPNDAEDSVDATQVTVIDFQTQPDPTSPTGVGASDGENGRVGFASGRGEGSGPTPARAQGGGGGGTQSPLPPSIGKLPPPSEIPAPIATTYARALPPTLPAAGINLDPVLWKDLPFPNYGDPRSKSIVPSNGPGEGGGVGTGKGTGIGEGNGPGVGPGNDGNTGGDKNARGCCGSSGSDGNNPNDDVDRVFRQAEVTTRARVLSKPEPQYTEEARKAAITCTVILSVVFSRTGQVTNIRAIQTLCCGLTEKAIAAAQSIRFIPAMRNGQVVSTYMQLQYNFNLY